jgi:hypothetical protein
MAHLEQGLAEPSPPEVSLELQRQGGFDSPPLPDGDPEGPDVADFRERRVSALKGL